MKAITLPAASGVAARPVDVLPLTPNYLLLEGSVTGIDPLPAIAAHGIKTSGSAYPNNVTFKFGTFYVAYWDGFTPNVTLSSDDRPF